MTIDLRCFSFKLSRRSLRGDLTEAFKWIKWVNYSELQSLTKVLSLIHSVETTANNLTFNLSIGFRNGSYESENPPKLCLIY